MEHPFLMFLDHTQRCSTVGKTPLDEVSARRKDLYLTIHNTHNRQHIHVPNGIQIQNPSQHVAGDQHLRQGSHWDRLC